MIPMISISSLTEILSADLGVEIFAVENKENPSNPYSFRFGGLDRGKSFGLEVSRSWKTTQVNFQADSFAGEFLIFIREQVKSREAQLISLIDSNQDAFSSIQFLVDGVSLRGSVEEMNEVNSLRFEVGVLTSESSIEYGILNEQEENLCRFAITLFASILPVKTIAFRNADEVLGFPEGSVSKVLVNKYERDPKNRSAAIAIHGKSCLACGFNYADFYGELGDEYIVVHHVVPVSKIGPDYEINPSIDLVTLCANCHAMVHRQDPPLSVAELRGILGR